MWQVQNGIENKERDKTTMDSEDEKRKAERFQLDLQVSLTVSSEQLGIIEAHTKDISSEGAYVEVNKPLEAGTPVRLELLLPVERLMALVGESQKVKVKVNGKVIRSNATGMAVQFDRSYKISTLNRPNGR